MTVLVDEARWEWRGAKWAHLVSDHSFDELHEFAQRIGKRRLGFQGDHYDIDSLDRELAVALGAEVVDSRALVRRLTAAGLRRRNHKPTWQRLIEAEPGARLDPAPLLTTFAEAGRRLHDAVVQMHEVDTRSQSAVFVDALQLVAVLDMQQDIVGSVPTALDVDEVWAGEARRDGERSLELFVSR